MIWSNRVQKAYLDEAVREKLKNTSVVTEGCCSIQIDDVEICFLVDKAYKVMLI
jgi:hypothetical protein